MEMKMNNIAYMAHSSSILEKAVQRRGACCGIPQWLALSFLLGL